MKSKHITLCFDDFGVKYMGEDGLPIDHSELCDALAATNEIEAYIRHGNKSRRECPSIEFVLHPLESGEEVDADDFLFYAVMEDGIEVGSYGEDYVAAYKAARDYAANDAKNPDNVFITAVSSIHKEWALDSFAYYFGLD